MNMANQLRKVLKKLIKGYLRDIFWDIYGKNVKNPYLPKSPKNFLFICKGNICRSPFAHLLAQRIYINGINEDKIFLSAGLRVPKPLPSPAEAVSSAASFGIHLFAHRSTALTLEMIKSSDMILSMETWQFRTLKKQFPQYKQKFYLLPLFDPNTNHKINGFKRYNIEDPYGQSPDNFRECFQRIDRCIKNLMAEINNRDPN